MSKTSSSPPWALSLIALLGAGLSFRAVYNYAEPATGKWGALATALLFDAAMWLSARWYLDTVRARNPLRPALWLSLALAAATLRVNVTGMVPFSTQWVVHGMGPALFAAFTWIEATIELRKHRTAPGTRERIPLGQKLVHPIRSARVWLMMLGSSTLSYAQARGMCQNRETQRRIWRSQHGRPWRRRIDPVGLVAYKWGAVSSEAYKISLLCDGPRPENSAGSAPGNVPDDQEHAASQTPASGHRASTASEDPRSTATPRSRAGTTDGERSKPRGWALPAGTSGRELDADSIADLARTTWPDQTEPAIRRIMRAFGISYAKARTVLELITQADGAGNGHTEPFPNADASFSGDSTLEVQSVNGNGPVA